METFLQVTQENARLAFIKADDAGKRLLANLFGEKNIRGLSWEEITSIELACEAMGLDPMDGRFTAGTPDQNAYHLLTLAVVPALRGDWRPDWDNGGQQKWWAAFWMDEKGGGFRFDAAVCGVRRTGWAGGSRLSLPSRDRVIHMVEYFLPVLRDFYL